eukprot:160937_1
MDDGYVKDENYVMENGKNGKMKRRQLKKKEIENIGNGSLDYNTFKRYQFTVIKDPSKTFISLPCQHPKAPNKHVHRKKKGIKKKKKRKRELLPILISEVKKDDLSASMIPMIQPQ